MTRPKQKKNCINLHCNFLSRLNTCKKDKYRYRQCVYKNIPNQALADAKGKCQVVPEIKQERENLSSQVQQEPSILKVSGYWSKIVVSILSHQPEKAFNYFKEAIDLVTNPSQDTQAEPKVVTFSKTDSKELPEPYITKGDKALREDILENNKSLSPSSPKLVWTLRELRNTTIWDFMAKYENLNRDSALDKQFLDAEEVRKILLKYLRNRPLILEHIEAELGLGREE